MSHFSTTQNYVCSHHYLIGYADLIGYDTFPVSAAQVGAVASR